MTITTFINSLIDNITTKDLPKEVDLILDGGAFNGIYMLGGLFYLKELEKRGKIKIKRISGCSIGAVLGVMFLIDRLDIAMEVCKKSFTIIRKTRKTKDIISEEILNTYINDDDIDKLNKILYITYFDTVKTKQIVKKKYKNKCQLIDCILKTTHIPYLTDGTMTYKEGCIDGAFPYIFKTRKDNRKIIFMCLQNLKRISNMIYIKNEKNIYPRLFEGLLDTHKFIVNQESHNMCSYVNEWTIRDILIFRLREIIYTMGFYIFTTGLHIDYIIPDKWKNLRIVKQYISIFKNILTDLLIYVTI
jgi:hypothetical protein